MPEIGAPVVRNGQPQRPELLAINLCDVERMPAIVREAVFGAGNNCKLDLTDAIRIDPSRADEVAVAFRCDLLTAALCCDVIRGHDRDAGDPSTRVYVFRKAWSKLPSAAMLTQMAGGKVQLHPSVFGGQQRTATPPPAPARRIRLGNQP